MLHKGRVRYDRTVIAYHGCDGDVARRLLDGEPFLTSNNAYDWLGGGIYFWEFGPDRALAFAEEQVRRRRIKTPAVIGALLLLGECFDLLDLKARFADSGLINWYLDFQPRS